MRCFLSCTMRYAQLRWSGVLAVVLTGAIVGLSPGAAGAQSNCPDADLSYLSACGPMFAVPTWTDAGGWTDPSQYSTIQLADVNGDGRDELLGRNDQGLTIWRFDTTVGQWRPQVDVNATPHALTDFRSPRPGETLATDWTRPQYYSTIKAADLDGEPGEEVFARFADGVHVYKYVPPAGTKVIDGGSWQLIAGAGPFSDAVGGDDPDIYGTIFAGQVFGQPSLLGRRHPTSENPAFLGRNELLNGNWGFGGIVQPSDTNPGGYDQAGLWGDGPCGQPSCYLNIREARVATQLPDPYGGTLSPESELLARTQWGVSAWAETDLGRWIPIGGGNDPYIGLGLFDTPGPFPDVPAPDCPFSSNGASGPGSGDCLGTSPSYYETMRTADVDGQPGEELLARASDGLRVKRWNGATNYDSLATLTALAGPASAVKDGLWGSIRTGDINGDQKAEVLALEGNGLQAWSYDPVANRWNTLPSAPPLALATDPWLTRPEYYATIRVGDVDGDGRDDVVARGQFGIRTWFYDRRGSGGWERYLPEGYPDLPGTATPPAQNTGQAAAYDKLNELAKSEIPVPTLRQVWASEAAPDTTLLQKLQRDLPNPLLGNCSNQTVLEPPTYASCTPPPPPAGATNPFTADDWKTVVNTMLAESQAALEVANFYSGPTNSLTSMRQSLFLEEGVELPAIGGKLGLEAAANTPVTYDLQGMYAGGLGIAASIAGVADPELSAALWVASELASTIPAGSATANSSFQTTYADLEDQFAKMVSEIDGSIAAQSQQIRQDKPLMDLVADLRSRGTWNMDTIGIGSAGNQGFAAWVYSTLMPTVYERYSITNCRDTAKTDCTAPTGTGVIGGGQNFTVIGQRHQLDGFRIEQVPCLTQVDDTGGDPDITCTWTKPPDDLLNRIWGPVDPGCTYVPGLSSTVWKFGCSAGVNPATSIGDNSWGFPSYAGNPDPYRAPGGFSASASATRTVAIRPEATTAQANPAAPIMLGRSRHGHRRAVRGRAQVRADTVLPQGMRLGGATLKLDRLLFDRRGRGELARPHGSRAPRPLKLTLRRSARGRFTAATTGRRSVRATVRRTGRRGRARITLNLGAATLRAPRACHALPASVVLDTPPLYLETRLGIVHGTDRHRLRLEHHVRCARDRRGNIDRLVRVREASHPVRRGLTVSLQGPRRVQPGTVVTYTARLRNQRRGRDKLRSSLWDVTLKHATRTTRIRELRRGRTRSVTFTRRVPRTTTQLRMCVTVVAMAAGARAADARSCAAVGAASPAGTCAAEPARHRLTAAACAARANR